MPRPGPRTTPRYSEEFKATAVKLSQMRGVAVGDVAESLCAAAPALFYADWVHPIPPGTLKAYRTRVLERPSVARVVDEARPYRPLFPLGAPDRD